MLLAKFVEGFIFGIQKKTNRLDDDDDSREEELLILADQVSTGIKEVEEQVNQVAQVIEEENRNKDANAVTREPDKGLEKEKSEKEVGGEQTRWWLGVKKEEDSNKKEEEEHGNKEEEEEEVEEHGKETVEEGSRKDLLDLANNFYQKAHKENHEKIKTVEYVPYDPAKFPKGDKNIVNNTIDIQGSKIEETERMDAEQIVDKVKMSIVEFDKEMGEDLILVSNKDRGENSINNKGNGFNKENEENYILVSNSNKGTGLFQEVNLAPTFTKEVGGEKKEELEKDDDNVETEGVGMFDNVGVPVNVEPVETKTEIQVGKETNNELIEKEATKEKVATTEEEKEKNLLKSEAELEDEMLTDWFQKMEDALNGVKTGPKQW